MHFFIFYYPNLQFYCCIMLVDPRPFTYQYRKPRVFNPTYQSRNLYQSLYHRYPYQSNDYFPPDKVPMRYQSNERVQRYGISQEPKQLPRNQSQTKQKNGNSYEIQQTKSLQKNPQREPAGFQLPSIGKNNYERNRAQSSIGSNMQAVNRGDMPIERRKGFERFRIYERQQKPFNIISCYPKDNENDNKLRNYPKLTLEDKLIQRGSYHTFRQEQQ